MDNPALRRARWWTAQSVVVATLAMMLAACHTTRVVWSKPGANQAELQSDLALCRENTPAPMASDANARATTVANDIPATSTRQQVGCMLKRGWRLTPLPSQ